MCKELFSTDEGVKKHMKAKHGTPARSSGKRRSHESQNLVLYDTWVYRYYYTVYKIEDGVAKNVYGTGYRLATTFFVVLSNFKLFQLKVKYHRDSVRKKIEQGQNN